MQTGSLMRRADFDLVCQARMIEVGQKKLNNKKMTRPISILLRVYYLQVQNGLLFFPRWLFVSVVLYFEGVAFEMFKLQWRLCKLLGKTIHILEDKCWKCATPRTENNQFWRDSFQLFFIISVFQRWTWTSSFSTFFHIRGHPAQLRG